MSIKGEILIGSASVKGQNAAIQAVNPATGELLEPVYAGGGKEEVERACGLAREAFDIFRETSLEDRANFLECIGQKIEAVGEELTERAMAETGLPRGRLEGERGRTVGQLKLFANVVRQGNWLDVRIDTAMPDRQPLPRADLRQRQIAVGPVAVFGASNFPLAFSVAGGDTASAFAAGCPVVVKAHSAHPGTSELVGRAIQAAVAECGLPEGTFSMLFGSGRDVGATLVAHPDIKAVGFTGSQAGGTALMKIAAARPEPIPVYAEMSSSNPVFLLPSALENRGEAIAKGFAGSLTMGAGQFCTNPGLVVAVEGEALDTFLAVAASELSNAAPQTMLTPGIYGAYCEGAKALSEHSAVTQVASGLEEDKPNCGQAGLFVTTAEAFIANHALAEEVFGATALVVRCKSIEELYALAEKLEGQLTATMQLDKEDYPVAKKLLPTLERRAGRVLCNAFPTGVEVCHAMVHGGPFPSTSDPRTTSVGSAAINRFLRPVCYQDLPAELLPAALQDGNPLGVSVLLDGKNV